MFINIWQTSSVQCTCWTVAVCEVSEVLRINSPHPPNQRTHCLEKELLSPKSSDVAVLPEVLLSSQTAAAAPPGTQFECRERLPSVTCQLPLPPHLKLLNFCCISRISCYCCSFLSYSCLFACFALMHTKYLYS